MADEVKQEVKEVKASANGIHISPRKARLVVNLIKNRPVSEVLTELDFLTKKAAHPIKKLVSSAVANARHNFQIEEDRLFIKNFTVDAGRVFFRYTPRAQGRAFPVRKRTSHLNLILGISATPFKFKTKRLTPAPKKEVVKPVPQPETVDESAPEEKKGSFLGKFWKRKKSSDPTQVPPKEDVKGKHYTGFDRRANP